MAVRRQLESERGAAWLAYLSGRQGVAGSNPAAPTNTIKDLKKNEKRFEIPGLSGGSPYERKKYSSECWRGHRPRHAELICLLRLLQPVRRYRVNFGLPDIEIGRRLSRFREKIERFEICGRCCLDSRCRRLGSHCCRCSSWLWVFSVLQTQKSKAIGELPEMYQGCWDQQGPTQCHSSDRKVGTHGGRDFTGESS